MRPKLFRHTEHSNGFCWAWLRTWRSKCAGFVKTRPHSGQVFAPIGVSTEAGSMSTDRGSVCAGTRRDPSTTTGKTRGTFGSCGWTKGQIGDSDGCVCRCGGVPRTRLRGRNGCCGGEETDEETDGGRMANARSHERWFATRPTTPVPQALYPIPPSISSGSNLYLPPSPPRPGEPSDQSAAHCQLPARNRFCDRRHFILI